jgi:Recombination directionality factor-like
LRRDDGCSISLNPIKEPSMDSSMPTSSINGHARPVAVVQSSALAVPTLLGRTAPRIPVAGRIRAGIKVLTRRAAENERVRAIYERGVEQGKSFDMIEREIADAAPELKNPLTPKNVPYFTVRGEDFPNPKIARQIVDLFAEDRGDGVKRLYRFPVVFPADAWQSVMPHELVAWTANERRFWSEYAEDGQTRYCTTHAPVPVDSGTRRAIRLWGGRKTMQRADNGGLCDPESCREYQDRKCNLSGRFIFFIPGIKSISAFELPTNSFYAMNAAIQKFQTIGFMRGGRISGFLDGKHTPFYITKRLVDVPRIDEEGRPVRTPQWLIELEAPVDVAALLRPDEGLDATEAREARASEAVSVLEGVAADLGVDLGSTTRDSGVIEAPAAARVSKRQARTAPVAAGPQARTAMPGASTRRQAPFKEVQSELRREGPGVAADEAGRVLQAAAALGVDAERFEQYADKRWGRGWKLNPNGRKRALDEVIGVADAEGFRVKVDAELGVLI